jgi:8-oxo-dGTP pyrophosphatase MutT (NUDIX family)
VGRRDGKRETFLASAIVYPGREDWRGGSSILSIYCADHEEFSPGGIVPESTKGHFIVNVEVAIVRDSRYLMIVRGEDEDFGAGWLTLPGGTVDWNGPGNDAIEATARREALEEVGLGLGEIIVYIESHTFGANDDPCLDVVVLATPATDADEPWIASPGEVAALRWMTLDEINADDRAQSWTHESLRRAEIRRNQLGW